MALVEKRAAVLDRLNTKLLSQSQHGHEMSPSPSPKLSATTPSPTQAFTSSQRPPRINTNIPNAIPVASPRSGGDSMESPQTIGSPLQAMKSTYRDKLRSKVEHVRVTASVVSNMRAHQAAQFYQPHRDGRDLISSPGKLREFFNMIRNHSNNTPGEPSIIQKYQIMKTSSTSLDSTMSRKSYTRNRSGTAPPGLLYLQSNDSPLLEFYSDMGGNGHRQRSLTGIPKTTPASLSGSKETIAPFTSLQSSQKNISASTDMGRRLSIPGAVGNNPSHWGGMMGPGGVGNHGHNMVAPVGILQNNMHNNNNDYYNNDGHNVYKPNMYSPSSSHSSGGTLDKSRSSSGSGPSQSPLDEKYQQQQFMSGPRKQDAKVSKTKEPAAKGKSMDDSFPARNQNTQSAIQQLEEELRGLKPNPNVMKRQPSLSPFQQQQSRQQEQFVDPSPPVEPIIDKSARKAPVKKAQPPPPQPKAKKPEPQPEPEQEEEYQQPAKSPEPAKKKFSLFASKKSTETPKFPNSQPQTFSQYDVDQAIKATPGAKPAGKVHMVPCRFCERTFAEDRVEKHEGVCKKVFLTKRKVFDETKMRIKGTELEDFSGNGSTEDISGKSKSKKADWRKKRG